MYPIEKRGDIGRCNLVGGDVHVDELAVQQGE
jgi:hypothetical protein